MERKEGLLRFFKRIKASNAPREKKMHVIEQANRKEQKLYKGAFALKSIGGRSNEKTLIKGIRSIPQQKGR